MEQSTRNPSHEPATKLCLALDLDRRTAEGRIRSDREFREHFFRYDASGAVDRIFKDLPRGVRGPVIASWGIRGTRAALRDDDERVRDVVHDALLAGDIDDDTFEQGLTSELLIAWCDLPDWWAFWRRGTHTKHSIQLALQSAYELGLFDAGWLLEVLECDGLRGTDVLVAGLAKADLARWLKQVHQSGDGSPKGLIAALGWTTLVAHTADAVLLRVIDGFARMSGLSEQAPERMSETPVESSVFPSAAPLTVLSVGPRPRLSVVPTLSSSPPARVSLMPALSSSPPARVSALPSWSSELTPTVDVIPPPASVPVVVTGKKRIAGK